MTKSNTPRTDAAAFVAGNFDVVTVAFAEQLETELNEVTEARRIISVREAELIVKYYRAKEDIAELIERHLRAASRSR